MEKILESAYTMMRSTPKEQLNITFSQIIPLLNDQYQVFNFYPKFNVDHHKKMRE